MGFEFLGKLTKDQARALLIEAVELLLTKINEDQNLAQHLDVKPFSYKNAAIQIYIKNSDRSKIYHPDLTAIFLMKNGDLLFLTKDPENPYKYKSEDTETYDEAAKLVQEYTAKSVTSL